MPSKLSRKQLGEALETMPIEAILGKSVSKGLTAKQKKFAMEVAKGATKADAYRTAYKANASPHSLRADPYRIAANPRIHAEIEAYEAAIEAAKYRTPAALRELVIQSLVSVVINPDAKDSVKVAAAKVLGTVTEVAAFTERKEIRTVKSSDDAKAQVLNQLRELMKSQSIDATIIERDADDLLAEISGGTAAETGEAQTHPPGTPQDAAQESPQTIHTIPSERSGSLSTPERPISPSDAPINPLPPTN